MGRARPQTPQNRHRDPEQTPQIRLDDEVPQQQPPPERANGAERVDIADGRHRNEGRVSSEPRSADLEQELDCESGGSWTTRGSDPLPTAAAGLVGAAGVPRAKRAFTGGANQAGGDPFGHR